MSAYEAALPKRAAPDEVLDVAALAAGDPNGRLPPKDETPPEKTPDYTGASESYRELFCRRCYAYDCAEHGARQPWPRKRRRRRPDPALTKLLASILRPVQPVQTDDPVIDQKLKEVDETIDPTQKQPKQKRKFPWLKQTTLPAAVIPCDHDGPCTEDNCSCVQRGQFCSKLCRCDDCDKKYPGCRCSGGCRTRMCDCVGLGRECDPDLCGCRCCGNQIFASKTAPKNIAVGRSSVHGWGSFLLDSAKPGDFVAEYKGDLITHDEADRRGKVYDKLGSCFPASTSKFGRSLLRWTSFSDRLCRAFESCDHSKARRKKFFFYIFLFSGVFGGFSDFLPQFIPFQKNSTYLLN